LRERCRLSHGSATAALDLARKLESLPATSDAFARGSKLPDAHPFLKVMAAQMAQHAGELQMAKLLWVTAYQSTPDRDIRANAVSHLRALEVDEEVTNLENLVSSYRERTGHWPATFSELEAIGLLRGSPVDPLGMPYKLLPEGRVEVRDPGKFPFIDKGAPPGYVPPPAKFLPSDGGA